MRPGAASIGSSSGVRRRIAEKHNFAPRHARVYGSSHHHHHHKKEEYDDSPGIGERFRETMTSVSEWFSTQFSKLKKKKEDDNSKENDNYN